MRLTKTDLGLVAYHMLRLGSRRYTTPEPSGQPGYAHWETESAAAFFSTRRQNSADSSVRDSSGFISTGSARPGLWHDQHSCYQAKADATVYLETPQGSRCQAVQDYITPAYKVDGFVCREQVLWDPDGEECWVLTCGTGFASGGIWRYYRVPGAPMSIMLECWRNPYEGGRSWRIVNGVPHFGLYDIKLPANLHELQTLKSNHSAWHETWDRTNPRQMWAITLAFDDEDWETIFYLNYPRLRKSLEIELPALNREALNSFKLYDSSPIVELIDTMTTVSSIRDLVPGSPLLDLIKPLDYNQYMRSVSSNFTLPKGGLGGAKAYSSYLKSLQSGINPKALLSALAATRLQWSYGIVLPFQTLSNLWKADTPEPWAQAIRSYWDENAAMHLSDLLMKNGSVLRHRVHRTVGNTERWCSLSLNLDLAPDDMFIEYWKALYASGILMTFEGVWDLVPLSFVVDWCTGVFKHSMECIDATTISQMIKVEYHSASIKEISHQRVTVDGLEFDVRTKFYIREITDGAYPTNGLTIHDFVPGFDAQFLPEAVSLAFLLPKF